MDETKINKYLEEQIQDSQNRIQKIFSEESKFILKTQIIERDKYKNELLPPEKTFSRSILNNILITIFGVGGFISLGIIIYPKSEVIWPTMLMIAIGIGLGIHAWFLKPNNKVTLNKLGINYNDNFIKWEDIQTTHIVYIERNANSGEDESYLILELRNGNIKKFELTNINFTNFYSNSGSADEDVFGHYIERYKNNI